ncbi:DUF4837 family protein [Fulvivirga maritima]|uniref:DUF4837 family protein n=1 Tax=Fulvivirga maritima TaxID=2904247 RepID=UPI001F38213C|nr:DUF4837 family protein [Fulvivirga maritima]UII27746.1 DUF4837 family protein [Fulvivirga maritima]
MKNISLITLIILIIAGCSGTGKKNKGLLPDASGGAGEIIIVMDSAQWNGEVGDAIKTTFKQDVPGLPREEQMFKINHVDPRKLTSFLKSVRNLVFVMTTDDNSAGSKILRNYFTKSSLDRINKDENLFIHTADDEYAKGQEVMYLFGQSSELLAQHIRENKNSLQKFFNQAEKERLSKTLFANSPKGLTELLEKDHGCTMTLPFAYKLAVNEDGFVWFRQMNAENDKNIFITYRPYTSESIFQKDQLIQLRDSIAKKQLFGDPDEPNSHLITETNVSQVPVEVEHQTFKGKYSMQMKGIWRTNNVTMGGPFISYTILDEEQNRIYYIEGFVYSPGKNQREYMREMDVILSTFDTKGSPQASAK